MLSYIVYLGIFLLIILGISNWARYKAIKIIDRYAKDSLKLVVEHEKYFHNFSLEVPSGQVPELVKEISELLDEYNSTPPWYRERINSFEEIMERRYPKLCKSLSIRGYSHGL